MLCSEHMLYLQPMLADAHAMNRCCCCSQQCAVDLLHTRPHTHLTVRLIFASTAQVTKAAAKAGKK